MNAVFRKSALLLAPCAALVVANHAAPQQQAPVPSELVLRVSTRMVLLDTVVTDHDGRPVTDLTQNDFSIVEDGKPQTIASFSVTKPPDVAVKNSTLSLPPLLPPHVTTNRPEVIGTNDHVSVLLLDGLNTPPQNQVYLKQQMLKFLAEHFDPRSRIAVVSLTGKLTVLQDFTSDPTLLKAALDRYQANSPAVARSGGDRDLSASTLMAPDVALPARATGGPGTDAPDPTAPATSGGSSDTIQGDIAYMLRRFEKEAENFNRDVRISTTLGALQEIARYLAGQRGRKSLLWFSSGFPISVTGVDPEDLSTARGYADQLRRTTNLLNDAHVAIYTIDASGLLVGSISDPANSGRDLSGRMALTVEANKKLAKEDFARMSVEDTLERAARDTGGRYFHGNDIANSIAVSLREAGAYYLLGYYPSNKKWDGKFRQVRVKVNRPGLTVHSRQGYFATEPAQWEKDGHQDDLKAAVGTNVLPATQVTFMARALPPPRNSDINVEFLVDATTVSFDNTAVNSSSGLVAGRHCKLTFEVQAFTPEGKLVRAEVQQAEAELDSDKYDRVMKQGIPMKVPTKLPRGRYMLHLGVRDDRTGAIGTAELAFDTEAK